MELISILFDSLLNPSNLCKYFIKINTFSKANCMRINYFLDTITLLPFYSILSKKACLDLFKSFFFLLF